MISLKYFREESDYKDNIENKFLYPSVYASQDDVFFEPINATYFISGGTTYAPLADMDYGYESFACDNPNVELINGFYVLHGEPKHVDEYSDFIKKYEVICDQYPTVTKYEQIILTLDRELKEGDSIVFGNMDNGGMIHYAKVTYVYGSDEFNQMFTLVEGETKKYSFYPYIINMSRTAGFEIFVYGCSNVNGVIESESDFIPSSYLIVDRNLTVETNIQSTYVNANINSMIPYDDFEIITSTTMTIDFGRLFEEDDYLSYYTYNEESGVYDTFICMPYEDIISLFELVEGTKYRCAQIEPKSLFFTVNFTHIYFALSKNEDCTLTEKLDYQIEFDTYEPIPNYVYVNAKFKIKINQYGGFYEKHNPYLIYVNLFNQDTTNLTTMDGMFYGCGNLETVKFGADFDTSNVVDLNDMFRYCNNLKEVDLQYLNTSNITDMSYLFNYCYNIKEIDLSNFDFSKVVNMQAMFANATSLTDIKIKDDAPNLTGWYNMFNGSYSKMKLHVPCEYKENWEELLNKTNVKFNGTIECF